MTATVVAAPLTTPFAPVELSWSGRPEVASSGNFAILQLATTDPDALTTQWNQPRAGVQLNTQRQMRRNQAIVTFVNFKGCTADAHGNCQLVGVFDVIAPDGKPYAHQADAKKWVDHPPAPDLKIQLSEAALGLVIEDKDALGPYTVKVAVTDKVSGVTLRTEEVLTAMP